MSMDANLELHIRMLGSLEIGWLNEPLSLNLNQKEQMLLCYLKCNGRFFSRREIEVMFWPTKERPQINLRVAINHLRNAGLAPFLEISDEAIAFNQQSPHWADIDSLEEQLLLAKSGTADLQMVAHAVDGYRGGFLVSTAENLPPSIQDWVLKEREQWQQTMIEALDCLLVLCIEQSLPKLGLHYGKWLLQLAPWHERGQKNVAECEAVMPQQALAPLPDRETVVSRPKTPPMQDDEILLFPEAVKLLCASWNIPIDDVDRAAAEQLCNLLAYHPTAIGMVGRSLTARSPQILPRFVQQLARDCAATELSGVQAALRVVVAGLKPAQQQLFEMMREMGKRPFTASQIAHKIGRTAEEIQDDLDLLQHYYLLTKNENEQLEISNR